MLNLMKIEDKLSSDDDEVGEIEIASKNKSKHQNNIPAASLDAFNQWKKINLNNQSLNLSNSTCFPFYYIIIDDEQVIIDEAKFDETRKLKNKTKNLNDIDEDEDEIIKVGSEYVIY